MENNDPQYLNKKVFALYSTWSDFQNNEAYWLTVTPITPVGTIPPDMTITSAIDGNDVRLNNGDSTTSNKITFTFKGTDNVAVAGFECRRRQW